jgi:pilus assembly protein CpaE
MFDRVVVAVLDMCDRAYVVLESVVPTLLGAVKLVELLRRLEFPDERQRVVVNRYAALQGSLKPAEVAERLDRRVDHVLPYDKRVIVSANTGEPYVLRSRRFSALSRGIRLLIDDIDALPGEATVAANGRAASGRNGAPFEEPMT